MTPHLDGSELRNHFWNKCFSVCSYSHTDISLWHEPYIVCEVCATSYIGTSLGTLGMVNATYHWSEQVEMGTDEGKSWYEKEKKKEITAHLKYASNEFSYPAPAYVTCECTNVARSVLVLIRGKSSFSLWPCAQLPRMWKCEYVLTFVFFPCLPTSLTLRVPCNPCFSYYYKWCLLFSQQHTINGRADDMPMLSSNKIMIHMTIWQHRRLFCVLLVDGANPISNTCRHFIFASRVVS